MSNPMHCHAAQGCGACLPDVDAAASAAGASPAAAALPLPFCMFTRLSVLRLLLLLVACVLRKRQLLDPAFPAKGCNLLRMLSRPEGSSAVLLLLLLRSIRHSSDCLRLFRCAILVYDNMYTLRI
jgi:hypothetical protein